MCVRVQGTMQGNTLPAIQPNKDAQHTHLPPPPDPIFQQSVASSSSQPSLHPFPGNLTNSAAQHASKSASTPVGGGGSGGGGGGDAWSGDQNGGILKQSAPSKTY